MSHGPPPLGNDFFGFNGQANSNAGPGVITDSQAAAAAATLAAHQKQQQQQQANDEALMMFFNEPPPAFFDSFDNLGAQSQPGSMFAPPQSAATSMVPTFDVPSVMGSGAGSTPLSTINGLQQLNSAARTDDSPSRDTTDGVESNIVMSGMNEPGAGPQPVDSFHSVTAVSAPGPGPGGAAGTSGTLTEFTRRKNWPAKVVEELSDLLQIIEPNGRIRFASPNITKILGFTPEEVAGQSLTELTHPDDRSVLLSDLNSCIANASVLRMYVRLRKQDGSYAIVEMIGHAHIAASRFAPNPSNKSPFCQAVFLMARPYPTKNANLLDSFLEHKMENERLRRRIDDLRREEEFEDRDDESNAQSWVWRQSMDTRSDNNLSQAAAAVASSLGAGTTPDAANLAAMASAMSGAMQGGASSSGVFSNSASTANDMPPPMAPLKMGNYGGGAGGEENNVALTRENLEGIASRTADSLGDKMARYEKMPGGAGPTSSTAATSGGLTPTPGSVMSGVPGSASNTGGPISVPAGASNGTGAAAGGAPVLPINASTADTIEMLTGLRYQEGERSRGLSTGNRSPRLIKGDAGIAFSVNRDQRASGDKKKKARLAEEYVCTDCGTLESPEWRKGPSGPKTLCNACGLRWAKKEKREKKKAAAASASGLGSVGGLPGVGLPGAVGSVAMGGGSSPLRNDDE
ncbi:white collar 2 type of transcription factor [Sporothrix bragantina]|uniref:White collar 2 type of transcription factor n=1 Tax=Sporothrix bragantina TaxID=671064 RepID=A0ABP0BVE4_9PEZI